MIRSCKGLERKAGKRRQITRPCLTNRRWSNLQRNCSKVLGAMRNTPLRRASSAIVSTGQVLDKLFSQACIIAFGMFRSCPIPQIHKPRPSLRLDQGPLAKACKCPPTSRSLDVRCLLEPLFEGCLPIINCSGIDERMIDTCRRELQFQRP